MGCHIESRTSNMQACTYIHGFTSCIVGAHKNLLLHNILIHHPAEGKGDHGRMKAHWKEHYMKPSARRQTRTVQPQADSNLCISSLRVTPAFHPDNYI